MGTGKGLLSINERFGQNSDLEECAKKVIRAKMRLIQGKDVVLGKGHLGRNSRIWGQNGFKGKWARERFPWEEFEPKWTSYRKWV